MVALENCFMAGKTQELQAGDIGVANRWETMMANCSRAIVTQMEGSTIQAYVAKLVQVSVKRLVIMEQRTYIVVSSLVLMLTN